MANDGGQSTATETDQGVAPPVLQVGVATRTDRNGAHAASIPAPFLRTRVFHDGRVIRPADGDDRSLDGLFAEAAANTRALPIEFAPHRAFARAFQLSGDRLSALLAVPERFAERRDDVGGELLVVAPRPTDVSLIGADEPRLWAVFGYAAIEFAAAVPRGLSPMLYRVVDADGDEPARLEPWIPAPDSPLAPLYHRARMLQIEAAYGSMMQPALIDGYDYDGQPAAGAAPQVAYDPERDAVLQYAVWDIRDPRARLLPPVDVIALAEGDAAPERWVLRTDLAGVPGVTVTDTDAFGLPVTVAEVAPAVRDAPADEVWAVFDAHGARSAAQLGSLGESASILDWIPGKNGRPAARRGTTPAQFPGLLWPTDVGL